MSRMKWSDSGFQGTPRTLCVAAPESWENPRVASAYVDSSWPWC